LTNNGGGTFSLDATLNVGKGPAGIVAADVNDDGKVDLICANAAGNSLLILTNNGNGIFGSNATINVEGPGCVAAADVNNDGSLDLVCANVSNDSLTIFTNNGNGVFGSNATYAVGMTPVSLAAADINADGKVDLITANNHDGFATNGTLTILTNNGSGIFGYNATLDTGNDPNCVVAADLNGDGRLDLISANLSQYPLTLFTQIPGPPPLTVFVPTLYSGDAFFVSPIVAADVNHDGKMDIIGVSELTANNASLTVFTNDGNGGFSPNATYPVGGLPLSLTAADINNDGKVDLITANAFDNTLTILTNDGTGAFGFNATLNVGRAPRSVIAADINGDGSLDLICANQGSVPVFPGSGSLSVLTNNGQGNFGSNATYYVAGQLQCVVASDVNNDGKVD